MEVNPSVRLYDMDTELLIPLEYRVMEFNLEKANRGEFVGFEEMISFKRDFEMRSLSPTEFELLANRIY